MLRFPSCMTQISISVLIASASLASGTAQAHVKWFAPTNVSETPPPLSTVADARFWLLNLAACVLIWAATRFEQTTRVQHAATSLEMVLSTAAAPLPDTIELLLRAGTAAFFISLWTIGSLILTPELQTEVGWIAWIQFTIAVGMVSRRTLPLSALGICALYGYGIWMYGLFHMLDYPLFLGLAGYLALSASDDPKLLNLRMPMVRWSVSASLMWVSIEKFAYAHWSYPILEHHPIITSLFIDPFGLDYHTFMHIAGTIEFTVAFAMIWTPLIRRVAAGVLLILFALAILEFGKIDAIGHIIPIIMVTAIFLDNSKSVQVRPILSPLALAGFLALYTIMYYSVHGIFQT